MFKFFRQIFAIFFLIFFLFLFLFAFWVSYQRLRDPLNALDRGLFFLEQIEKEQSRMELLAESRIYSDVTLYTKELDSIFITISFPTTIPSEGLPVLIVLGGLEIGRESLKYIPAHGQNIIIAYQYPYSPRYWYDGTKITQIPIIHSSVMKVPAQIVNLAAWTRQQSWSDKNRISVLGYSFGAFFIPAIYHLAGHDQVKLGPAVMAYGGVDIYRILRGNLKFLSAIPRTIIAWMAAAVIHPVEPALHLPYMNGEFLVINGRNDHQIPNICWQKFQELTPKPKTVMVLDAGHMHPSKPELTLRVVELSRKWLLERNAINP